MERKGMKVEFPPNWRMVDLVAMAHAHDCKVVAGSVVGTLKLVPREEVKATRKVELPA